ncbi:MAG: hypothetical protein KDE09_09370, partial [Anaerolineales bacterium]|nr:hypothetical protein [Anaerolineales bacterium]
MRRILILLTTSIVTIVLLMGAYFYLAESHPYRPHEQLFPQQELAERIRLRLTLGAVRRADWAIDLLAIRYDDLEAAGADTEIRAAISAFHHALDEALLRIAAAPEDEQQRLFSRLNDLLFLTQEYLQELAPAHADLDLNKLLLDRVEELLALENLTELQELVESELEVASLLNFQGVPFLDEVEHDFFPLVGEHAGLECNDCHQESDYAGTPAECSSCHVPPEDHFPGACNDCHTIMGPSWAPEQFDHRTVTECAACHTQDAPKEHFPGDCATCHVDTDDWAVASFGHEAVSSCMACHMTDAPPDHYPSDCIACHTNVNDWTDYSFSHQGQMSCQGCHSADAPANHYPGDCIDCHFSTDDWAAVSFDHTGVASCTSCHSADAPPNHYPGDCVDCHTS